MLFRNYSKKDDESLMVLFQQGDHRAFTELFDRYSGKLKAYFFRMLWSDNAIAEDHVHDLFTKIINKPELFNASFPFKPWVFQVAYNMCKNTYRKRQFEEEYLGQLKDTGIEFSSIEMQLDKEIQQGQLEKMLKSLNAEKRNLFVMRYQQNMSVKEIAEVCDLSEGTVKSRLYHLRQNLIEQVIPTQKENQNEPRA